VILEVALSPKLFKIKALHGTVSTSVHNLRKFGSSDRGVAEY